jgi:SsrA-binding protein
MNIHTLLKNRTLYHNYEVLDEYTAGIQLHGSEVKAIKAGSANLVNAFCYFVNNELFIKNFNIVSKDSFFEHEPERDKKLLLKKKELRKIQNSLEKHFTIVPISFYLNERGLIKCDIAIARGKKNHDKKMAIKEKEAKRELREYEYGTN